MHRNHARIVAGLVLTLSCSSPAVGDAFQYAELHETQYMTRDGRTGVLLGFSTDPGYPVTVMEEGRNSLSSRDAAYKKLFEECGWGKAQEYDLLYVLNFLGRHRWEVIYASEKDELVFAEKYRGKTKTYLLKRRAESELTKPRADNKCGLSEK